MPVVLLAATFFCHPFFRMEAREAIFMFPLLLIPAVLALYCIDVFEPQRRLRAKIGEVTADMAWCMGGSLLVAGGLIWPQYLGMAGVVGALMLLTAEDASGGHPAVKLTLYVLLGLFAVAEFFGAEVIFTVLPPLGLWSFALAVLLAVVGRWSRIGRWWRPVFLGAAALFFAAVTIDWRLGSRTLDWVRTPDIGEISESFGDLALSSALPGRKEISMYYRGPLSPARAEVLSRMADNYITGLAVEAPGGRPSIGGNYDVVLLSSVPSDAVSCDLLMPLYAAMARGGYLVLPAAAPLTQGARGVLAGFKYAEPLGYPPSYMVYSDLPAAVTLDNFGVEYDKLFPENPFVPAPVLQLLMREKLALFPPSEHSVPAEFASPHQWSVPLRWWWLLPGMALFFALRLFCGGGAAAARYFDGFEDGFYYGMIWGALMSVGVGAELAGNILPSALTLAAFIVALRIPGEGEPWRKLLGWLTFAIAPWWLPSGWLWVAICTVWWRLSRRSTLLAAPAFLLLFPYWPMAALYGGSMALVSGILTSQCMREPFDLPVKNMISSYNATLCCGLLAGAYLALYGGVGSQLLWLAPALMLWRFPAAGRGK